METIIDGKQVRSIEYAESFPYLCDVYLCKRRVDMQTKMDINNVHFYI